MSKVMCIQGESMPRLTSEQVEAAVRGELVVEWNGRKLPLKLTREDLEAFEQAREDGFVVVRRRSMNLPFAYSAWCDALGVASVKVEVRRKYAAVQLHMITASPRRLSGEDVQGVDEAFRRFMEEDAWCMIGELYCTCDKVLVNKALVLARTLVFIGRRAGRAQVDVASLQGGALERAFALGYLTCADVPESDELLDAWRAWCREHWRPMLTLRVRSSHGNCVLDMRPNELVGEFSVEQIRRVLACVRRVSLDHMQCLVMGEAIRAGEARCVLSAEKILVSGLEVRTGSKLCLDILHSFGFEVQYDDTREVG